VNAKPQRKMPARRVFTGLAGSPLAKLIPIEAAQGKSDHSLRVPKTPDREEPLAFDVWFDQFNQKHGRIDLDCSFQEYAFDPHLGQGANPIDNDELPSHAAALRIEDEDCSPRQDLGITSDGRKERGSSFSTGLIEGDRQIKRRRSSDKTWWIFDSVLFRDFIRLKYDPEKRYEAEKAAYVLYHYYHLNREDEQIGSAEGVFEGWRAAAWFNGAKEVKQYRQYLVKQGAEQFKDQKPESTWHGRRSVRRGFRCSDPNCTQCAGNEISRDYSGRDLKKLEIHSGQKVA
jgi:hypothetical protein